MSSFNSGGPFGGYASPQSLDYRSEAHEMTVGRFFNAVYAWMAVGLAVTATVAYGLYAYAGGIPIGIGGVMVLFLVQLGLVYAIGTAINRISAPVATLLFVLYAALNGVLLSSLFIVYTHTSIATVFLVTAGAFAGLSLFGFTTGKNLATIGGYAGMALWGLILASVINLFLNSPMMQYVLCYAGVLIFTILTAANTQKLKRFAEQSGSNVALANRVAISGSLMLYLDFINLFLFLLQLFGDRRR